MKIVIPGGTGQVGTMLAQRLVADGHDVVVLSRNPQSKPWRMVNWDGESVGAWAIELDGADVVINLAGRSVNCRYTTSNRRAIIQSRVKSTQAVGKAIAGARRPPPVWLQMSTATIYSHRYDAANDELTGIIGGHEPDAPAAWRFSIDVATAWERTANEAITPGTRKVLLRSAMVMSPDRGGIFDTLRGLARWGLGGKIGDGRQYMSWIHEEDFVRSLHWIIERPDLEGAINLASPNPLPQADFMRDLRKASGVRIGLPATKWMLEIGTFLMRTESELVLKSRVVVPRRLLGSGFQFDFPDWPAAAIELCKT